jgi:hypothetical protein
MAWMRGVVLKREHSNPALGEYSSHPYDASLPAPLLWRLATALALVSMAVVVGVVVLLVSGQGRHLRRAVDALVPDRIVKIAGNEAPRRVEAVANNLATGLGKVRGRAPSAQTFGIGSTRRQVRAVQGSPDRESDSIWWYGNSEVYFSGARVVGWKVVQGSPLKTR